MAKVATSSEATVVEAELRSTLASIEASIARTQADVVVIKKRPGQRNHVRINIHA
jgi:hypothetical protein